MVKSKLFAHSVLQGPCGIAKTNYCTFNLDGEEKLVFFTGQSIFVKGV